MTGGPIERVVIVGGGIVAWSCAAGLKRHLPRLDVAVVALPVPAAALADRMCSTLPSIVGFHRDLRLGEENAVVRAGSGFRLGSVFAGWGPRDYAHVYGRYGQQFGTASFHHHWVRAQRSGAAAPFDAHAPAAELGRAGRFVHPQADPGSLLGSFDYGLTIQPPRYREMMRAFALHLGASELVAEAVQVRLHPASGFVDSLALPDGRSVNGHLFIDCSGPAAVVRSVLDDDYDDWSRWLACDRVLSVDRPAAEPDPLDHVTAGHAGWRWEATSSSHASTGLVYCSAFQDDADAARALGEACGAPAILRPGRRPQPWLRNCLALGDAAMSLDPLEWTGLHLAHSGIDRLVAMMPDRECARVEIADYNRQTAHEADRVRDFLVLHYRTACRSEPMWRELAAVAPPDSLAHTLSLFAERGRLPFYEEETFSRDSWLAVLLGQGVLPRRTDPLIDTHPPQASLQAMTAMRDSIKAMVMTLPTQSAYLHHMHRQVSR